MDGIESRKEVFLIGATNRPGMPFVICYHMFPQNRAKRRSVITVASLTGDDTLKGLSLNLQTVGKILTVDLTGQVQGKHTIIILASG